MVHQTYNIHENVLECIGNTPIVRLNKIPIEEGIKCEVSNQRHIYESLYHFFSRQM